MSTQSQHSARSIVRAAINGQANGYRPVTEAELQALKSSDAIASDLLDRFFKTAA